MRNIKLEVTQKKLIITIDLNREGKESASGKSLVIASTEGNVDVPGVPGLKLGLNCYRKHNVA